MRAVFAAGASVILFLKIRAGLDPAINEANPQTWRELLAVLARKQYDVRPIFPRSVDFVDAMPRTPTGKLYKRLLRDPYWQDAR